MDVRSPARRRITLPAEPLEEPPGFLHTLRERLIDSRAERGPCPQFDDLKQDFLPRIAKLEGRKTRAHHLELCLVCQSKLRRWRSSWSGKADWSMAATAVTAHRIRLGGISGLRWAGRLLVHVSARTTNGVRHAAAERRRSRQAAKVKVTPQENGSGRLPPTPGNRGFRPKGEQKKTKRRRPGKLPALVVLEGSPGLPPAGTLAEAVEARGGALVIVDSIEEIFADRDFRSVHTIVLTRQRPFAELPSVYETIRGRAPGRAVFAVVTIPPNGSIARDLAADSFVIPSPLTVESWVSALASAGWELPD